MGRLRIGGLLLVAVLLLRGLLLVALLLLRVAMQAIGGIRRGCGLLPGWLLP